MLICTLYFSNIRKFCIFSRVLPTQIGQNPSEILTVSKTGKVTTKRVLGTALVYVQVSEDNAIKQEMSVTVQVKSITYIMLNALPMFKPIQSLDKWPLGLKLPLEISYHDESGTKFDAIEEATMISALTNRPNRYVLYINSSLKNTA